MTYTHFRNNWCIVYPQTLPDTETSTFIQTLWLKTGNESLFSFDLSGCIHKFKIKSWESRLTWAIYPQLFNNSIRNIHEPILCKLLNENFSNTIQISEVTNIAIPQQMLF